MTMAEMERKLEALEKRVRELESRPQQVHYHYPVQPVTPPQVPYYQPWWQNPITCTGTI